MKIKVLLILVIMAIMALTAMVIRLMPYHFYYTAIDNGITSEYINLKATPPAKRQGRDEVVNRLMDEGSEYFQTLWKDFHFSNFNVPFPVHHHQIQIIPMIKEAPGPSPRPLVGAKYIDSNGQEIFSFIEDRPFAFKINMDKEKIFSFPLIRQVVLEKKWEQVWLDFFTYNVDMVKGRTFLPFGDRSVLHIPWRDIAYGLFITHMRQQYLKDITVEELKFVGEKKMGLLMTGDIDERYAGQTLWIYSNGTIYPINMRLNRGEPLSKVLRDRFVSKLQFMPAEKDSAIKIYANYKLLPYRSRISQEGMVYLYSCFSHEPLHKDFLREMIQFLERGKDNFGHLRPLYDYALKKFGSTLSSRLDKVEDAQSRLERKISEEHKQELHEVHESKVNSPEENFQTTDDKMRFYLNKAKESSVNSDEQDPKLYK